eukprot:c8515_g1_i1 orf=181-399(+)
MDGWHEVLEQLQLGATKQRLIRDQSADYRACSWRFARANAFADHLTTNPCVWWEDYKASTLEFQEMAIKILI